MHQLKWERKFEFELIDNLFLESSIFNRYEFPWPAQALGWMMGLGSILLMVFGSAWNVYKRYRNGKEITGLALLRTTPKWRPKTSTGLGASTDKLDEDL